MDGFLRGGCPHDGHRDLHEVLCFRFPPGEAALRLFRGARTCRYFRGLDGDHGVSDGDRLAVHSRPGAEVRQGR